MGHVEGENIVCRYHGLAFDGTGRCTRMPSQDRISPSARVRAYPTLERHRLVWVWPGDPARADPARVPDLRWNGDPGWEGDGDTLFARCDYRLLVDNLMDLTHETFVHATSIGHRAIVETPAATTHNERTVTVTRWMLDIDAPPFWRTQLGRPGNVDRWQIIRFEAPSTICIDVGVAKAGTGAPEGDRSQGVNGYVLNTITPETERTSHYFWAFARDYKLGDQRITTQLREGVSGVFFEDETMLNAQQRAIEANPGYDFYNLNIDAGGMWVRRLLDRMVAAEAGV